MYNILTDPLFRFDRPKGARTEASLPEVYAALMADEVDAFPALRPHQRHAWHAFLVQLGAMAMHRAGLSEPPGNADDWRDLIRGLTPDYPGDEPWQLVVDDITRPAFMQPRASSPDKKTEYKFLVATSDELDMLVTSKNHDLKSAVAVQSSADDWIFALITLQTTSAQDGVGNYSVSRIRSAYSGRPAFSLAPVSNSSTVKCGAHVRRDIVAILEYRPKIFDEYASLEYRESGGISLLWTEPWDGGKAEAFLPNRLDPFYLEICRRVRLCFKGNRLEGIRASSKATRLEAKALEGRTGDPWTPVDADKGQALNVGPAGFTYKRIIDYLTSWEMPTLLVPTPSELRASTPMALVARSLKRNTRKQGMTEGYDERIIPLRQKTMQVFGKTGGVEELGDIARNRIEQIAVVHRILRHAVSVFAAGGKTESIVDEHRARANPWANKLNEIVDADFFEDLQDEVDADTADRESIHNEWLRGVVDSARKHYARRRRFATLPFYPSLQGQSPC